MTQEIIDHARSELDGVREAIKTFENLLLSRTDQASDGTVSDIPYKLRVVRQGLLWRTRELADGAFIALTSENRLSAAILARSLMETAAVQTELARIVKRAGTSIPADEVEEKIARILADERSGTQSLNRMAMLGMIDAADQSVRGFRRVYDALNEYALPQRGGTLALFSDHVPGTSPSAFARYVRGHDDVLKASLNAIKLSLYATSYFLEAQIAGWESFCRMCDDHVGKTPDGPAPRNSGKSAVAFMRQQSAASRGAATGASARPATFHFPKRGDVT